MFDPSDLEDVPLETFYDVLEDRGRPVVTASELARIIGCSHATAEDALGALVDEGVVERLGVKSDPVVWYPRDWKETVDRERVVVFPDRHEIVIDQPSQLTRAKVSQFARLVTTNRSAGYVYEIRPEDVWHAPFESVEELLVAIRRVVGERIPALFEWVTDQWDRATKFRLYTHEDGYVVLEAANASLLGNVVLPKLDDDVVRARISDTEAWIAEDQTVRVKEALYAAEYPVVDERELKSGASLDVSLSVELRDYQKTWVEAFESSGAGVLVGPPGSGKTVTAVSIMARVGGETLVLVPSRDLVSQWRRVLESTSSLSSSEISEYHGGAKEVGPVTIATYQTAGMDRHRALFEDREWGLVIYDEVHHVPSPIYRRSTALQSKHRLGLSSTPVREDEHERDIFTLIGPPIGTDWEALFDAGFVVEPVVEVRYVPWESEMARNEYASADGHDRRQLAATNPAKLGVVESLVEEHRDSPSLVFVEYLEQGNAIAEELGVPFVSGEMPHSERDSVFDSYRSGELSTLVVSRVGDEGIDLPQAEVAVSASGLGGSRRQGAQRAGRTMRPVGQAQMYVLATQGTVEEEFVRQRLRHLASKGIRVREQESPTGEGQ